MDSVKLALGRADAAADALVRVDDAGTAAQTAGCLDFNLILGQRQVRIPEGTVGVDALVQRGGLARGMVLSSSWKSRRLRPIVMLVLGCT